VIVSSGAVAAGRAMVGKATGDRSALPARQALAALGQAQLIGLWQRFFTRPVAQVLLTHDDLRNRRRYLNARATLTALLAMGALPVVNENDTVAVDELKLGDNDNLAATVAALVDADLLLIATDIGGLFSAHPQDPAARPVDDVEAVTPAIMAMAGAAGSSVGTGGMVTKLQAAQKAASAGIATILFDGGDAATVRMLAGQRFRGTCLHAAQSRLAARKYWLSHAPAVAGAILVDGGAARALLERGGSLLPGGVLGADGEFARGDMVEIHHRDERGDRRIARGIAQYAAVDIRRIAGRHTRDIDGLLGYSYGENVVHRDDLVTGTEQD
jgi:glutamate 5-kinase